MDLSPRRTWSGLSNSQGWDGTVTPTHLRDSHSSLGFNYGAKAFSYFVPGVLPTCPLLFRLSRPPASLYPVYGLFATLTSTPRVPTPDPRFHRVPLHFGVPSPSTGSLSRPSSCPDSRCFPVYFLCRCPTPPHRPHPRLFTRVYGSLPVVPRRKLPTL